MTDPLAAPKSAGAAIWLNDLSRERSVQEDSVRAKYADAEHVLARIQGARVHHGALTAGLEDEGAAALETAWEALRKQLSARLSSYLAKAP